ncbi:MAG: GYD domain-containing protein [Halobacteriales archaeon]|nr:GYD domain-containing protein [Halobacteriales archaeon]
MPTFITLISYESFEMMAELDPEEFLEPTREVIQTHGGELLDYYLTMGQYDAVAVAEFPNAEAATQAYLTVLQGEGADTETLRAFTEEETRNLITSLSD